MDTGTVATSAAALTADDVARYHADGFLIVRGVFSAERIAELDAESQRILARDDLIDSDNIRCRWQNQVETGECRFDCFDPVMDLSEACERAARDPRLLEIVGALYGEPASLLNAEDTVDPSKAVVVELAPGDAAILSGYTPHRSAPNRSAQSRRLLYLSYNALSDGGEQRDKHYAEFRGWLQDRYVESGKTSTFFR